MQPSSLPGCAPSTPRRRRLLPLLAMALSRPGRSALARSCAVAQLTPAPCFHGHLSLPLPSVQTSQLAPDSTSPSSWSSTPRNRPRVVVLADAASHHHPVFTIRGIGVVMSWLQHQRPRPRQIRSLLGPMSLG
ncbi:uncharacterized protein LOC100383116 [Zea mays]|uniref:Uncharacterized protein n=2 Tax=Zea mays TaxID=4577 RepID=C0PD53_MAIZE|nr:uncharacterized protein LOC100383116 [Zea mays]ACN32098.1 unknown [Zea mays]|eukprot:NP_001169254.1 uncharacterized protein LOC100383116 [Zea mays]